MHPQGSLLDDSDYPKASDTASKTHTTNNTLKIAAVVVLLLLASGVLAWSLGLFGHAKPAIDMKTQAEYKTKLDAQLKAEEEAQQRSKAPPPIEAGG